MRSTDAIVSTGSVTTFRGCTRHNAASIGGAALWSKPSPRGRFRRHQGERRRAGRNTDSDKQGRLGFPGLWLITPGGADRGTIDQRPTDVGAPRTAASVARDAAIDFVRWPNPSA